MEESEPVKWLDETLGRLSRLNPGLHHETSEVLAEIRAGLRDVQTLAGNAVMAIDSELRERERSTEEDASDEEGRARP